MIVLLAGAAPGSAATRPLTTGFTDSVFQQGPPESDVWLDRAKEEAGAGAVLLSLSWRRAAATRPADPRDPRDPAYDWQATDVAVRAADARGLRVALTVISAPAWAEGPRRPDDAVAGTWRPSASAFGEFVTAAARRYSGRFMADGGRLPRICYWQAWSEPNLDNHISPQWTRRRGRSVPASPGIYRGLLNAAYRAVKGVHRSNRVITGASSTATTCRCPTCASSPARCARPSASGACCRAHASACGSRSSPMTRARRIRVACRPRATPAGRRTRCISCGAGGSTR